MNGLVGSFVFLTRLPIRTHRRLETSASVPWFPVAGLVIGALVGGCAALLQPWASPAVAASVAIVLGMLVTGCFHEDGLADVADAFVGGWTRDDRLRILKDPRHGTYGVAALAASIALRIAGLASLVAGGPKVAFVGAVCAHGLARAGAVSTMLVGRPATGEGLGADYVSGLVRRHCLLGIAITIATTTIASGWWIAVAIGAITAAATSVGVWSTRKIGGFSGDVLGAIEQVGEISILVSFAIVAGHHPLWW